MVASSFLLKKGSAEAFKFLTNETDWLFTADGLKYSLALGACFGGGYLLYRWWIQRSKKDSSIDSGDSPSGGGGPGGDGPSNGPDGPGGFPPFPPVPPKSGKNNSKNDKKDESSETGSKKDESLEDSNSKSLSSEPLSSNPEPVGNDDSGEDFMSPYMDNRVVSRDRQIHIDPTDSRFYYPDGRPIPIGATDVPLPPRPRSTDVSVASSGDISKSSNIDVTELEGFDNKIDMTQPNVLNLDFGRFLSRLRESDKLPSLEILEQIFIDFKHFKSLEELIDFLSSPEVKKACEEASEKGLDFDLGSDVSYDLAKALATELGLDFDKLDIKKIKALILFAHYVAMYMFYL